MSPFRRFYLAAGFGRQVFAADIPNDGRVYTGPAAATHVSGGHPLRVAIGRALIWFIRAVPRSNAVPTPITGYRLRP